MALHSRLEEEEPLTSRNHPHLYSGEAFQFTKVASCHIGCFWLPDTTCFRKERFWPRLSSHTHTKGLGGIAFFIEMTHSSLQRIMKPFASLGRLLYGKTVLDAAGTDLAHPNEGRAIFQDGNWLRSLNYPAGSAPVSIDRSHGQISNHPHSHYEQEDNHGRQRNTSRLQEVGYYCGRVNPNFRVHHPTSSGSRRVDE